MSIKDDFNPIDGRPPRSVLLQMITGFWISQAIYVAAKLGIADLLQGGPKSSDDLAQRVGASPKELYRLLRFLASVGVFAEDDNGRFTLTPLATALQTDVSGSLHAMAIMYGEEIYQAWGNVLHSVKTGETAFEHVYKSGHFSYLAEHPAAAAIFNQAMTAFTAQETSAILTAYDFASVDKVVDVGGGQGFFIAEILKANPLLQGILFELPQVIGGAKATIETAIVAERCEIIGGDFFESIPGGGDLYILKNIILNWDDEQSIALLKNCRHAMGTYGKLLVIEAVIPPRNEPSFSKLLDLHMLVVTGGHGRTEAEFQALFSAAGFRLTNIISTHSPTSLIKGVPI